MSVARALALVALAGLALAGGYVLSGSDDARSSAPAGPRELSPASPAIALPAAADTSKLPGLAPAPQRPTASRPSPSAPPASPSPAPAPAPESAPAPPATPPPPPSGGGGGGGGGGSGGGGGGIIEG